MTECTEDMKYPAETRCCLDAMRLRLVGSGDFDATEFLPDDLRMAYRLPSCSRTAVRQRRVSSLR